MYCRIIESAPSAPTNSCADQVCPDFNSMRASDSVVSIALISCCIKVRTRLCFSLSCKTASNTEFSTMAPNSLTCSSAASNCTKPVPSPSHTCIDRYAWRRTDGKSRPCSPKNCHEFAATALTRASKSCTVWGCSCCTSAHEPRSTITTSRPCLSKASARLAPANPPPTITTSH